MEPTDRGEQSAVDIYPPCVWCNNGQQRGKASCALHLCEACCRPKPLTAARSADDG